MCPYSLNLLVTMVQILKFERFTSFPFNLGIVQNMKLIITLGTQSGDEYIESSRCAIEIAEDASVADALAKAKEDSAPLVANPTLQKRLEPYLYLMHPDTLDKLDEGKKISDYGLKDGSILRLMSAAR